MSVKLIKVVAGTIYELFILNDYVKTKEKIMSKGAEYQPGVYAGIAEEGASEQREFANFWSLPGVKETLARIGQFTADNGLERGDSAQAQEEITQDK
jgi:hypothetical protein